MIGACCVQLPVVGRPTGIIMSTENSPHHPHITFFLLYWDPYGNSSDLNIEIVSTKLIIMAKNSTDIFYILC